MTRPNGSGYTGQEDSYSSFLQQPALGNELQSNSGLPSGNPKITLVHPEHLYNNKVASSHDAALPAPLAPSQYGLLQLSFTATKHLTGKTEQLRASASMCEQEVELWTCVRGHKTYGGLVKCDKVKKGQEDCGNVKEKSLAFYSKPCPECAPKK